MKKNKILLLAGLIGCGVFFNTQVSFADDEFDLYYYEYKDIDENLLEEDYDDSQEEIVQAGYYIYQSRAFYRDESGKDSYVSNKFFHLDGNVYYADSDGYLSSGLVNISGTDYYFYDNSSLMLGQQIVVNNRLCVADGSGRISYPANKQITISGIDYITDNNGYLVEVQEEDDYTVDSFDGITPLEQNNDELSPTYKLGLSASQIEDIINHAFPNNMLIRNNELNLTANFAKTLVAMEKQLGINPFFILGIINAENPILNGTLSQIVADKNNLMSWNCYDDDPYGKSSKFDSYADSIILPAKYLRLNYLDKNGWCYVDGTVAGVNKYYATDPNWKNNVLYGMKALNSSMAALKY